MRENREAAWNHLFLFSRRCLIQPTQGGHRRSLATHINQAIEQERDTSTNSGVSHRSTSLAKRVSVKLENGDFREAVRLVNWTEPVCRADKEFLRLLQKKHSSRLLISTTRHTVTSSDSVLLCCHPCYLFLPHGLCRWTRWIAATAPKRPGHLHTKVVRFTHRVRQPCHLWKGPSKCAPILFWCNPDRAEQEG